MKALLKLTVIFSILISLVACSSDDSLDAIDASIEQPGSLDLTFNAMVDDEDFQLDKEYSIHGEQVSFNQLRYWISNVSLISESGERVEIPNSYFLLEETEAISVQDGAYQYPAKKRETISLENIPAGDYKEIEFSVGIDSTYNNNLSLQAGELSQLNGMTNISWMWHTSYIFSSLKGTNLGDESNLILETGLNSSYRKVIVALPETLTLNSSKEGFINLKVNIPSILDGVNLGETPMVGASTPEAMELMANNFQDKVFTYDPAMNNEE